MRWSSLVAGFVLALAGAVQAQQPPSPNACESGEADPGVCANAYDSGYRVECFSEGQLVFKGEAYKALAKKRAGDALPYVQADGEPVAPLWEEYGACKLKRYDGQQGGAAQ